MNRPVNFKEKLTKFTERWSPRVVAEMNDWFFRLSRGVMT